ncbi:MAG: ATPase [Microbacteriaceae bacterium]|nr:ATPase [Microbacteriaceae bacterium]
MRIRTLTIAGFGPYRDEQVVDFDRFATDGIFLITGKTGAGKSSILDAICFALYSSVPRYDGTQSKLRSDHCRVDDPSFVELEFSAGGCDYRVRRVPEYERPKKRGEGVAKQAHEASLSVRVTVAGGTVAGEDAWRVLAAKPVHVADELSRIVGLTKDQFLQVVLLAQNRFQEFLLAKNDERQGVLRTLFGSKRFERLEAALDDRRKLVQASLASADEVFAHHVAQIARLLDLEEAPARPDAGWFAAALAGLAEQHSTAKTAAEAADLRFGVADMELRGLLDVRTLQQRRLVAATTLDQLAAQQHEIADARATVEAARRAAPVWPLIGALRTTTTALDAAKTTETAARTAYEPLGDVALVDETIDELSARLGTLADVLAQEKLLPRLDASIAQLTTKRATIDADLTEATELGAALPERLELLNGQITTTAVLAGRADSASATLTRVTAARTAAASAVTLARSLDEATVAHVVASTAHTAAAVAHDELLLRRLSGHAAELAAQLTEGAPCAVCGSTAHPAPATGDGEPVTPADLEAARATIDSRRGETETALALVGDLTTRLAEARARADGKSVEQLDGQLETATHEVHICRTAVRELDELESARRAVREALEQLATTLAGLRDARDEASAALTDAVTRRSGIATRIETHRGDAPSVSARVRVIEAHLAAARALTFALAETRSRQVAHDLARATLERELVEQGFDDVPDAERARLSPSAVNELEALIRRHDEKAATAVATLEESGMAEVPDEPIDVEPARTLREAELEHRDAAFAAATTLSDRLDQLRVVIAKATEHQEATGQRRAEFEQLRQLANVVRGEEPNTRRMRLETFVLAAQLEEIVAAANTRLRAMSGGRYALEHDDALQYRRASSGLGLAIRDEHTGRTRATHSLSGGETFLASLALALGLAEVVTNQAGGITLDTLFVDEGFGSLDADTLETAMSTLDGLRQGGRTIGLISHVEAMKEQIPAKLRITVSPQGHSSISESYELV